MVKSIAVRGKKDIVAVFNKIAELSGKQDTGRKQATLDIINYIAGLPLTEDTKVLLKAASKQHIDESDIDDVPSSIKIILDDVKEATWDQAMMVFKYAFDLAGNPQMPYFLKVGGKVYIKELENQNAKLGVTKPKVSKIQKKSLISIEDFKELNTEEKLLEIYRLLLAERGE